MDALLQEKQKMRKNTTMPTIGRKLWFYCSSRDDVKSEKQPFDATVIYVHDVDTVDLQVTSHFGNTRTFGGVTLMQPAEDDSHGLLNYATWMPYQMQQHSAATVSSAPAEQK